LFQDFLHQARETSASRDHFLQSLDNNAFYFGKQLIEASIWLRQTTDYGKRFIEASD
jgi:hypothetical protein